MSGWDDRERCRKGCGDLRLCEDGRSAWSPPPQPPPPPSLLLPLPVSLLYTHSLPPYCCPYPCPILRSPRGA